MSSELRLVIVMVVILLVLAICWAFEWLATWLELRRLRVIAKPADDSRNWSHRF